MRSMPARCFGRAARVRGRPRSCRPRRGPTTSRCFSAPTCRRQREAERAVHPRHVAVDVHGRGRGACRHVTTRGRLYRRPASADEYYWTTTGEPQPNCGQTGWAAVTQAQFDCPACGADAVERGRVFDQDDSKVAQKGAGRLDQPDGRNRPRQALLTACHGRHHAAAPDGQSTSWTPRTGARTMYPIQSVHVLSTATGSTGRTRSAGRQVPHRHRPRGRRRDHHEYRRHQGRPDALRLRRRAEVHCVELQHRLQIDLTRTVRRHRRRTRRAGRATARPSSSRSRTSTGPRSAVRTLEGFAQRRDRGSIAAALPARHRRRPARSIELASS